MGVKGLTLFHLKSHLQVPALWTVNFFIVLTFSSSCFPMRINLLPRGINWLFFECFQKYRLGKQSGKEMSEQPKDGMVVNSKFSFIIFVFLVFILVHLMFLLANLNDYTCIV